MCSRPPNLSLRVVDFKSCAVCGAYPSSLDLSVTLLCRFCNADPLYCLKLQDGGKMINQTKTALSYDIDMIRADFPILAQEHHDGVPLVYLDNAATSQKPLSVIEALDDYYRRANANVHRGIHKRTEEATVAYEEARGKFARFIK